MLWSMSAMGRRSRGAPREATQLKQQACEPPVPSSLVSTAAGLLTSQLVDERPAHDAALMRPIVHTKAAPPARPSINTGQRPLLTAGSVWSRLQSEDGALLSLLHSHFSYEDPAYKYLRKARGSSLRWDGRVEFFKKKEGTGLFLTGLLPDVTQKLDDLGIRFDLVDSREAPECELEVNADTLSEAGIKLHDYQVEIANAALTQRHGIIKCATGGGKTLIFAAILKAMQGKPFPALVLFRNKSLVSQSYDLLRQCKLPDVGRVNMDYLEPAHITCATIQSLRKVGSLKRFKALIVDEVHEFSSSKSLAALKSLSSAVWRLGFSATPFKEHNPIHNMQLRGHFGALLADISTEALTVKNILADAEIRIHTIDRPYDIKYLQPWNVAEEAGIVQNAALNEKIVQIVDSLPEGRIMILVRRLAHGDILHKLIPGSYWIQGSDSAETRDYVLSKLRDVTGRKKTVAIVSAIGYIGLNVFVHHLINATGGKDANSTIQKLGRGLRKAPDKERVVYHDFLLNNNVLLQAHSQARIKTLQAEGHPIQYC